MPELLGLLDWDLQVDKDGHRDYSAEWLIEMDTTDSGPATVMAYMATEVPIGTYWSFGTDLDAWAFCWPNWKIKQVKGGPGELSDLWTVSQIFTTKPLRRCQDESIEDPLLMPAEIGGSFTKCTKPAMVDRNGNAIKSSSHEPFTGSLVEFDNNRPNVSIGLNLVSLPLSTYAPMIDTVNDATLWGLAARKIKLSNVSWQRKIYGMCNYYYTVTYEFDIDKDTFDRKIIDSGTKILKPGGAANNPDDFMLYEDSKGGNTRVFLDGAGAILGAGAAPFIITVEKYAESNFLTLGIPTSL